MCRPEEPNGTPWPCVPAPDSVIVLLNSSVQVFRYPTVEAFVRTAEQIDSPILHTEHPNEIEDPVKQGCGYGDGLQFIAVSTVLTTDLVDQRKELYEL